MSRRSPTGRLSRSEPAIQNIPIRTTEGHKVHTAALKRYATDPLAQRDQASRDAIERLWAPC